MAIRSTQRDKIKEMYNSKIDCTERFCPTLVLLGLSDFSSRTGVKLGKGCFVRLLVSDVSDLSDVLSETDKVSDTSGPDGNDQ